MQQGVPHSHLVSEDPLSFACFEAGCCNLYFLPLIPVLEETENISFSLQGKKKKKKLFQKTAFSDCVARQVSSPVAAAV